MIVMVAGGMIAAWMVEIKYWFEIGGAGAALFFIDMCGTDFAAGIYLHRDDIDDAFMQEVRIFGLPMHLVLIQDLYLVG